MKKNKEKINQIEIKSNFKSNIKVVLTLLLFGLVIFSLISGVNAITFNEGSSSSDIQNFINNDKDDTIIFNAGTYNNLKDLNITRTVSITSNGRVNIIGNGGTLFNVTASNVIISNLNINGYQTAIRSNSSKISIIGNNITTTDISIYCTGSNSIDITLENNNIISSHKQYGSGAFYVKSPLFSVNKIHMKGNNISAIGNGDYSTGVWLDLGIEWYETGNIENTLILENNNISGSGYADIHISAGHSKNNMQFTNNYFEGSRKDIWDYAVDIAASGGNNKINFINNTIIGPNCHGLYIYGDEGTSEITLINNTIKGGGAQGHGFYFLAMDSNNTITLTNNNITGSGTSRQGVDFDIDYSNNTVTFTKNNIQAIGSAHFAVYIHADGGNNTIIFTENNLTGAMRGLSLVVEYANNNITFTNNNLTGTNYAGMILYVSGSTNNNIKFIGNNFSGKEYATLIWAQTVSSGVSFINNTFTSDNTGIHFILWESTVSDFNFIGNTIIAGSKGFTFEEHSGRRSNIGLTVNFNRIIAPIGLDFRNVLNNGSNFDYNWWGMNDISNKILGFTTNNNYILSVRNLTSLEHVVIGDKVSFALLVLNTTLTNEGVENLPYFIINGTFNGIEFISTGDSGFIHEFTILNEGLEIILDHLDEQDMDFYFEGFAPDKPDNSTGNGTNNNPDNGTDIEKPDNGTDIENPDNGTDDEESAAGSPEEPNNEEEETDKDTNDNIKNKKVVASMKPTGVPMAILLVLAILSLLTFRRRKNK